jgi:hypothetical protein
MRTVTHVPAPMPWLAVLRDWLIGILIGLALLFVGGVSAMPRGGDGCGVDASAPGHAAQRCPCKACVAM